MSEPVAAAAVASDGASSFEAHPHRTLLGLVWPVFIALSVEPIAATIDTGFVAQLGATAEAALGAAVMVTSSTYWIFGYVAIGTQSTVAQAVGQSNPVAEGEAAGLGITVGFLLGLLLMFSIVLLAEPAVAWMGATGATAEAAISYVRIRALAAPVLLPMLAAFGALRGRQDMVAPMRIAVVASVVNVICDPLFMFTFGWGLDGAAWATGVSHLVGATGALWMLRRRFGASLRLGFRGAAALFTIGRDMVIRTSALMLFLLLCTRAATAIGDQVGAAHQMLRQTWMLAAFMLDAFASAAQTLIGTFLGAGHVEQAKRVGRIALAWGAGCGGLIGAGMFFGRDLLAGALLPTGLPQELWFAALCWSAAAQPVNAVAFVTDGLHMGALRFTWLRNGMLVSTALVLTLLFFASAVDLTTIWRLTAVWITLRAGWGLLGLGPGAWRGARGATR